MTTWPHGVFTIECPHCGAPPGNECRYWDTPGPNPKPYTQAHRERWDTARQKATR